jgi:hypothetical protein
VNKVSPISGKAFVYAASGAWIGAIVRYLVANAWPSPSAFRPHTGFPIGAVLSISVTVGATLFVAGFTLAVVRGRNVRAFIIGLCTGAASIVDYSVIGVSSPAAMGLLLLIIAPTCGLVGLAAGTFLALALKVPNSAAEERASE